MSAQHAPILVTGATGTVGRHLVHALLDAGHSVRALSRRPALANLPPQIEVIVGDLADPASLTRAFEGCAAAHLITFGGDAGEALECGADIVALAERAGVRRVTVLGGWEPSSVEEALQHSAIGWTRLEPVEFMANALEWAPSIKEAGVVRQLSTWPSAAVHEADIAAVAAVALTQPGHAGRAYQLTGPQALTPAERVALIAAALNAPLSFEQLTEQQERERLRALGYPDDYIEFGIQLATAPPQIGACVLPTVEQITGRPALTFAKWAAQNAAQFQR